MSFNDNIGYAYTINSTCHDKNPEKRKMSFECTNTYVTDLEENKMQLNNN